MKIKISNDEGCASVAVTTPEGETVETRTVEEGQEVTLTAVTANSPSDIEVGEVSDCAPAEEAETGEGDPPQGE